MPNPPPTWESGCKNCEAQAAKIAELNAYITLYHSLKRENAALKKKIAFFHECLRAAGVDKDAIDAFDKLETKP